ncbi:MAG: UDP-N-acetylglucosamine 2-epimerase (hydrolyzing) [Oligoflexia bacterium]|nr:UDP-N-acetylglucosamine 2-epimerase (hydrolyzing) [Oligoflexia bacterium]
MKKRRKIAIVTGTRAEYGLLKALIDEIISDSSLLLQLIVTGTHLSSEFGNTYKQIEEDGLKIDKKIEMLLSSDTPVGISKSMALGLIGFSDAINELKPDILVFIGDRFEILCAGIAGIIHKIPMAHIGGGESTRGAIDEAIRHSLTKMAQFHFVSTQTYKKRIIQLGENPSMVFNVGALGAEVIKKTTLLSKHEIESMLKITFKEKNFLVTYHPVTLENNSAEKQIKELLKALVELENTLLIFTKSNADEGGRLINKMIDEFVERYPQKAVVFISLGQLRYLSIMKVVDGVIGNSSSGIVEAPSFKIGTIDIGNRQAGRVCATSIINCDPTKKSISDAINRLYSKRFQNHLKKVKNPHEQSNTVKKIKKILKEKNLTNVLEKTFFDL